MSTYKSNLVKCPFYKDETKNTIRCEGLISRAIQSNFEHTKDKKTFREKYCCNNYLHCLLYDVIAQKYS